MKAETILLQSVKERHQPAPKLTIDEVLEIAHKIAEETGRYPTYGKLVGSIELGKVDPWQYIRKKRKVI